ncbi:ricin-type beta-trefoil lectin domain protein [Streptomyces sp. NPDC058459]|uniref:ricin-type beta-trefoil lectin domain protein n=1 Tax=Streptomyces sp. NPDC058459 TaxID=3346508 RepID=UPI00364885B2
MRRLALAVAALVTAAGTIAMGAAVPAAAAGATTPLRVMPLGDSITDGVGSSTGDGYRRPLRDALSAAGHSEDFVGTSRAGVMSDPDNEGHPGWRIDQIADIADGSLARYKPNVVTLMIGTNDLNQNYQVSSAGERLHALVDRIVADAPAATVLLANLIVSTSSTVNAHRAEYNEQVAEVVRVEQAAGRHVRLVDMAGALTTSDLADSLHPGDAGYQKMAAAFSRGVQAADDAGWLAAPVPNGTAVTSALAGKCLDVLAGGSANGTAVQSWSCNNTLAQSWTAYDDGSLRALGKCLDIYGGGTAAGTPVVIWECNGGTNQRWKVQNGTLVNPASGRCLAVPDSATADGTRLELRDCADDAGRHWTVPASIGLLRPGLGGLCADVQNGSGANGNAVQTWGCNGGTNQLWLYTGGTVQSNGRCLDVLGGATANGTLTAVWSCNGGANQQWRYVDGALVNPASGRCLDVPGASTANGSRLQIWDCNGGANQRWTLPWT